MRSALLHLLLWAGHIALFLGYMEWLEFGGARWPDFTGATMPLTMLITLGLMFGWRFGLEWMATVLRDQGASE